MSEVTKKKKGSVHYKKDKMRNPELVKYKGCEGCVNICLFNRAIVTPDEAKSDTYFCNSLLKVEVDNV